ncbi:LLM class flavin-dependent oxidoreductase [Cryptosporangium japonicum]|uniref:LLM class flavin-dependent oxidoreductase n=1 Tax=Cryptosporangium japonicum TaxID=80872 RepID=A0ABP3EQF7_9ACTN
MTHLAVGIDGSPDVDAVERAVRIAEDAGFAFVTFDDAGVEAGVLASYLALRTSRIGLAPTLHTTTTEPFHLATQLASLDHATLGRAAWVVGAPNSASALATIGRSPLGPQALRREVSDVVEVARALWDSWEDDAVIRDVATGRFLDADRVHHVNFTGDTFSVVGPLITPRPPQGQVVVLGSDTLDVTARLDVALVGPEVAGRAAAARADGAPLVFADVDVLIDETGTRTDTRASTDRLRHVGTTAGLRELLAGLAGTVDGVVLHPADLTIDLPLLADAFGGRPGPARTLRDVLGLPRPANRFTTVAGEGTP